MTSRLSSRLDFRLPKMHAYSCWRVSHSVTHKHELWIWLTLSYAIMKALLRLAAVRDTKQPSELRGDTVQFIASSSALVLMTQNGNIYRPLTQTTTCLLRLYSSNISQKTVNGSGRRQLAHGTTDEKRSREVPRDRKYIHRKASRKTHSTNVLVSPYVLVHIVGPLAATEARKAVQVLATSGHVRSISPLWRPCSQLNLSQAYWLLLCVGLYGATVLHFPGLVPPTYRDP